MEDLSLHILDIAQNCIDAKASFIQIRINEDNERNELMLEIKDNGTGMDKQTLEIIRDPLGTTKKKKFGLGIPLFLQSAEESGGRIEIQSEINKGTAVKAYFQLDNIDMKPLGDVAKTLIILIGTNPAIDFYYLHKKNTDEFELDTRELKRQLDGIPINAPEVMTYIREQLEKWYAKQ
ncbi:MAG: hypothetical protein A2Y62_17665 [Candidatus Fischerbacteria bacterium RBG_13_37_8]|uniref:Histidine kinase domain-containing protein n=1 Tax=Candidatus Fischerbacteria bacterium RBG_13_37_8 TaxID=1817863 RepID=A0A1F5VP30_9BACT|nr:MAG: hypothetical protein A2Y62_17665 [Candidatus Fischerbacteria bacterium RBG_13_37_8]